MRPILSRLIPAFAGLLLLLSACQTLRRPAIVAGKLNTAETSIRQAIEEKKLPGGVLWVERAGQVHTRVIGDRSLVPDKKPAAFDTIYDMASLTKVMATTPAMLLLIERGRIQVDAPVRAYIPEFTGEGRERISVRHLMTHTSGLRPGLPHKPAWKGAVKAIELACVEKPQTAPGTAFKYSDINFILLGEIVARVSSMPLQDFVAREIYRPLGMIDTGYLPAKSQWSRIAPTEPGEDGSMLQGVVHDPTARAMGGVAGHAGLFSSAADTARFARMLLNGGTLDGVRLFKPETVRLMTSVQSPPEAPVRRGLGWDIDSPYSRLRGTVFPIGSYGHTGWTGTSLWVDPFSGTFWIFLSNRNHPDGKGNVTPLRAELGTIVGQSVADFDFAHVPGALAPLPQTPTTPASASSQQRTQGTGNTKTGTR